MTEILVKRQFYKEAKRMLKHVCNICGKDFDLWDEQENFSIRTHVGYGSEFDGSRIELDMCCGCFDKLMNIYILPKCKIPPMTDGGGVL